MQYIQFQPQVAASVAIPDLGNVNLFTDDSDKKIKIKDSDGIVYSYNELVQFTKADLDVAISTNSLVPGNFYIITNAASDPATQIQDGGTTIILQATSGNTLAKRGVGLFWNPTHYNPTTISGYKIWDNTAQYSISGVTGLFEHNESVTGDNGQTGQLLTNVGTDTATFIPITGDWSTLLSPVTGNSSSAYLTINYENYITSYTAGDIVIWGGRMWENLNGNVGYAVNTVELNSADWQIISFGDPYTLVANTIEYEYEFDNISYRSDGINEIRCDHVFMYNTELNNTIQYFPFGNLKIQNVSISNCDISNFINFINDGDAIAQNIKFADYGKFNAITWGRDTRLYDITADYYVEFDNMYFGYGTIIRALTLGTNTGLYNIYTSENNSVYDILYNITLDSETYISSIYMWANSYIGECNMGSTSYFQNINLYYDSYIECINMDGGVAVEYVNIGPSSYIQSLKLGLHSSFTHNDITNTSSIQSMNIESEANFSGNTINDGSQIQSLNLGSLSSFINNEITNASRIRGMNIESEANFSGNTTAGHSYINFLNMGVGTTINNINIQSYSYLGYINLDCGAHIAYLNMNAAAYINSLKLGSGSEFQYNNIADLSYINNADIGINATFNHVNTETSSYIESVNIGMGGSFNNNNILDYSHIQTLQTDLSAVFTNNSISASSYISDFKLDISSEFSYNTLLDNCAITNIQLPQTSIIAEQLFTPSFTYNACNINSVPNGTTNTNGTTYQSDSTLLDTSRKLQYIDITGQSDTLSWYLPDGLYEGQQMRFILKNTGGIPTITPSQIEIFMNNCRLQSGQQHGGWLGWYPFAQYTNIALWKSVGILIWLDGLWTIDNDQFTD